MKKIVFLLFGLLALLTVKAQERSIFTSHSPEGCVASVDSMLQGAKRAYKLIKSYPYDNQSKFILDYRGSKPGSADSVNMRVVFIKRAKGANPAMEIAGETVYELQAMYGKFLDIFPVWNKYVDPTADMSAIATKRRCDRKKFENPDGSGEEYNFKEDSQDKSKWQFQRSSWYTTVRL
ncbi:MAG: hypothetical protein RR221_06755 [Alistipes sp.]